MAFLFDTNVFLEILLDQEKKETCKALLNEHIGSIYISDFSLHSIGVILLKQKKAKIFDKFLKDLFGIRKMIDSTSRFIPPLLVCL